LPKKITEIAIPESVKDMVELYRTELIERAASQDDVLMDKYFSGEELTVAEIKAGLRKGICANELY
jgi:elongation factor G